ncbi:MAG: thiamine pyrophosphate-dependent dehydrogenase E1 component subunit alpha [Anaerolineae bacterium]|nr:thiamine pyrophosphate-dependent dehydrogenase E1 component subunit alpha [Anaerolineae bacterium]
MYEIMWRIRRFEEAAGAFYQAGRVKGGIHASIGQEAVATGVCFALRPGDLITSTHRGHGHHIAKGADLNRLMAELLGKATGYNRGRGGSMHMAAFDVGSLGAFPVVAAGVPVAVGAALGIKMQEQDRVVVAFFGDGAMAQGTLHESINLAALAQAPVIFVCENNQFAVSTRPENSLAVRDKVQWATSYGIPAWSIDGQSVDAVYDTSAEAVERARAGGGPCFIEAMTYRFEGHYFGEPQVYRTREEVDVERRDRDPIARLHDRLLARGVEPTTLDALNQAASEAVEAAVAFAEAGPEPDPETFADEVYSP